MDELRGGGMITGSPSHFNAKDRQAFRQPTRPLASTCNAVGLSLVVQSVQSSEYGDSRAQAGWAGVD